MAARAGTAVPGAAGAWARGACATLARMLSAILLISGAFATVYGSWQGYAAVRKALLPLVRDGEPTRTLVERAQPPLARGRVRLALRQVLVAVAWLVVAMYGLYLATIGLGVAP